LVYHANLLCRTVNRILLRIADFTARSYPELYNKLRRIDWEQYLGFTGEVAVVSASRTSRLHHTDRINETVFSALRDHQASLGNEIVSVKNAVVRIFVRFLDDTCTVSIDSSGALLYKRGYRHVTGRAPLRETTAAALLMAASWQNYRIIVDPCCGTGSIILEGLRMALGLLPGNEREFAFFSWPSFSERKWNNIKHTIAKSEVVRDDIRFVAQDIDTAAMEAFKENCGNLHDNPQLTFGVADCREFNQSGEYGDCGLIVSNLPYGKRVAVEGGDIDLLYKNLGARLRGACGGWSFAFLVADPDFEKKSGLRGRTALTISNGGIPVRLVIGNISEKK
jgi:putative N6-adenine-specific DNA methylase